MNKQAAHLLEQHFNTAFAAPNGIQKLRELILTLAMQGRLVPQDPSDAPASQLLKEIEAEKKRLVKEGKIKAPKLLPSVAAEEVPYALPQGWVWVKLGMVAEINGGFAFKSSKYSDCGMRVIRISDFDEKGFKDHKVVRHPYSGDLNGFKLESNNILMAMTGGTVGKSLLVKSLPEPMIVNQRVAAIKIVDGVVPEFINGLLLTNLTQSTIQGAKNSTNDNISMGDITGFFVPLPPLLEQHRIVAKIDELMTRCDALENLQNARKEKRLATHAAALSQLLDTTGNGSSDDTWAFITQHFGELYVVKENVAELRKAILQLAVMGKLVPQDPNDPPASQLLKDIEAEKKRLVKEGKIRGTRGRGDAKELTPDEMPNPLPKGWQWVRLSSVFVTSSGNTFDATLEKETGAFAYVKVGDMNLPGNELIITTSSRFIDPDEKMSRSLIPAGSIIFPKRGGAIATNKKRIVCNPIFVDLNTMAITPIQGVVIDYAYLWLLTIDLATLNTGTSVPQINHQDIDPLPFPLPPQPEQHRIVAKIDQLMSFCDTLEQKVDAAARKQTELLNAVMAQV